MFSIIGPLVALLFSINTYTLSPADNCSDFYWYAEDGAIVEGQGTETVKVKWLEPGEKTLEVHFTGPTGMFEIKAIVIDVTIITK